ncbi:right-handed parallel beta-helix repeat-containing protein, partial [Candidatus Bathycorpusculum sp.]|uniref:right-handed parallel beta-helix repeat-containing protein n=1 Tax=Candidatus Bathycorpusculum sp. TaxID=2994959 RepID=UPI00283523F6|nr:right-handed parallel beta-helix repeat-containing protein [Candidatus Termitimicrobium sp.]
NKASSGGGIYNSTTNRVFTINGGTISDNTANNSGGGIYHTKGTLNIQNSTINKNTATYGAGIYNSDTNNTFTLKNNTIDNNTANWGGGIYSTSNLTMTNNTITNNTATNGNGGGIYQCKGTLNIQNSTINKNTANWGGGIFNSYTSNIFNNSDTNNTFTLKNNTIDNNTATNSGGAIHCTSNLTMTNNTITNNTATNGNGGGIYQCKGTLNIQNGQISNNKATQGGGIYNDITNDAFFLEDSTIDKNTATNGNGGGIYHINGTLNIQNSTINKNTATNGNGGGIYHGSAENFDIDNSTITNNKTRKGNGGGIWVADLDKLYIDTKESYERPTVFLGNTACQAFNRHPDHDTLYADRIKSKHWSNTVVPGTSNTFKLSQGYNNHDISYTYTKASKFGECRVTFNIISLNDTEAITWTIKTENGIVNQPNNINTNFKVLFKRLFKDASDQSLENLATTYTAALWYEDKTFRTNTEWNFNTPIYERDLVLYAFDNVVFDAVSAKKVIEFKYQKKDRETQFSHIIVTKDIQLDELPAEELPINISSDKTFTCHNPTNNSQDVALTSKEDKRHFSITGGNVTLAFEGVKLQGQNSQFEGGGGIEISGTNTTVTLKGAYITNCNNQYGGAICVSGNNTTLNLQNNTTAASKSISSNICNNTAEYGGAISVSGNNTTLNLQNNTRINSNTATANGGAIHNTGRLTIDTKRSGIVTGGTILDNTADINGGGIYNLGALTVLNCKIDGNAAQQDGGGIYHEGPMPLIICSPIITNNQAKRGDGGGIWIDTKHLDKLQISEEPDALADFSGNKAPRRTRCSADDAKVHGANIAIQQWKSGEGYDNYDISYPQGDWYYNVKFTIVRLNRTWEGSVRNQGPNSGRVEVPDVLQITGCPEGYRVLWFEAYGAADYHFSDRYDFDTDVSERTQDLELYGFDNVVFDALSAERTLECVLGGAVSEENFELLFVKQDISLAAPLRINIGGVRSICYRKLPNGDQLPVSFISKEGVRHFEIVGGEVALVFEGVKLQGPNGNSIAGNGIEAEKEGGGIHINNMGTIVTLDGVIIEYCKHTIANPIEPYGGAIYIGKNSVLCLQNECEIRNNSARYGGGVANFGSFILKGSKISNNTAMRIVNGDSHSCGGGVYNGGVFEMSDYVSPVDSKNTESKIMGNKVVAKNTSGGDMSGLGGGVYNEVGGTFWLFNGTISLNKANMADDGEGGGGFGDGRGGGVYNNSSVVMANGSILDNDASKEGKDVYTYGKSFEKTGGAIGDTVGDILIPF